MNKNQIYVHGENNREPKLIEISEKISEVEIIEIYKDEFDAKHHEEVIEIFLEDEETLPFKNGHGPQHEFKKRSHIHCHRCKKITVTVFYNGDDKPVQFPPSVTAKVILKKAVSLFGIKEEDSSEYLLKLEDATILQPSDHIGSFAAYPQCQVKLFLTPTKPVQG
jgi:hypothetical protein